MRNRLGHRLHGWQHDLDGEFFCPRCGKYPPLMRETQYCPLCGKKIEDDCEEVSNEDIGCM